jgi:hypothetical protein
MRLFGKEKRYYRNKFHNLYYFCPSSFLSLKNLVFQKHDKIYNELTVNDLNEIYEELVEIKKF